MNKSFSCAVGLFAIVAVNGVASAQAVEWKVSDGGNGHWYQAVPAATYFTWSAADAEARAKGGYLVTITDASEANFVRSLINSTSGVVRNLSGTTVGPWIGAVKDPSTLQFGWCTREPWSYTEWAPGEPTGASWEDRICYYGSSLRWNDRPGEYSGNTATPSYLAEWSADCNNDGVVDYGQIRSGQLSDVNSDGVPDICDGTRVVPSEYPTIQSAIDASHDGDEVVILPGLYRERIVIIDKAITLRGISPESAATTRISGALENGPTVDIQSVASCGKVPLLRHLTITKEGARQTHSSNLQIRVCAQDWVVVDQCIIRDCDATDTYAWGGAFVLSGNAQFSHCFFQNNRSRVHGSGISAYDGVRVIVQDSVFCDHMNSTGLFYSRENAVIDVADCVIQGVASLTAHWANGEVRFGTTTACGIVRETNNGGLVDLGTNQWNASCSDCDLDGVPDSAELLLGWDTDLNSDGVPDSCQVIRVPAGFATIQAAIDAATPGKTIEVSAGTYNEAIDLKGKAITVKAVGARANTIIDGTGKTTSVVRAVSGETSATVLQGFTIRNGPIGSPVNTYRLGGGMFIDHASPTIRDCAFVNNAAGYGGAIYGRYSDSLVENCAFSQNTASTDGGGVQFFAGSPVVRGCTISDNLSTNRGGGLHLVQHTTGGFPTVDGCTITGNRTSVSEGGGVSIAPVNGVAQKPLVSNCTIQGNTAQGRGGGLYAPVSATAPQPNATLVSNTICGNTSSISKRENTWALFEDGGNAICDCFSDIDGNGSVNTGDIGFALLFVGDVTDPDYIQPDQDMNGFVDTADIALLLLNFGQCT